MKSQLTGTALVAILVVASLPCKSANEQSQTVQAEPHEATVLLSPHPMYKEDSGNLPPSQSQVEKRVPRHVPQPTVHSHRHIVHAPVRYYRPAPAVQPAPIATPVATPIASPVAAPVAPPATRAVTRPIAAPSTALTPTPTPNPAPASAPASAPAPTRAVTAQVRRAFASCALVNEKGLSVKPMSLAQAGNDIYFLGPHQIWLARGAVQALSAPSKERPITLSEVALPQLPAPVHEFGHIAYVPGRKSIVVLDKSGDLFELLLQDHKWQIFRENLPFTGAPDPEFIDFWPLGANLAMLDPERNQVWVLAPERQPISHFFRDVLPWQVKAGDQQLMSALSICIDGDTFVVHRNGSITRYGANGKLHFRKPFNFRKPTDMRPSRIVTGPGCPLVVIERQNNRVVTVDKATGASSQFLFPVGSDLRSALAVPNGFWAINGDHLVFRDLPSADLFTAPATPRPIDPRLTKLTMPILGGHLPPHVGVMPGARRLYRYGVHEGMDFFDTRMGTPARAAQSGTVLRADLSFKDMDAATFYKVMKECREQHRTSDYNEDLYRGCQVWIDHGQGLVTRYAHLMRVNPQIKKGQTIKAHDLIGFVGISGTGENLPGHTKVPHLHFETWLDDQYVGWGLTPAETLGVYEDIFKVRVR